jgi:hypothetical protein
MAKAKPSKPITAVDALRNLREDIKELDWEALYEDGRTLLIAKAKALELVNDWIEYCLDPSRTITSALMTI